MISVRNVLVGLAFAFTAYLAARGLWWTAPVPQPLVVIVALALYLATTWLCLFWEPPRAASRSRRRRFAAAAAVPRGPAKLPAIAAALALACAFLVPSAISRRGRATTPARRRSPPGTSAASARS